MSYKTFLKCLYWSFILLLWTNQQILWINAASIRTIKSHNWPQDATTTNISIKQFKWNMENQQQIKTQTFLELLLGIADTLQFGKRKIRTPLHYFLHK